MTNQEKLPNRSKSSFLKRFFVIICITGVIVGATIAGSQIMKEVQQSKGIKEEAKRIMEEGDSFAAKSEQPARFAFLVNACRTGLPFSGG